MIDVDTWLSDLKGDDLRKANAAAAALVACDSEAAMNGLVATAGSAAPGIRARAINVLGKKGAAAQKALIEVFQKEQDAELKFLCAVALGRLGHRKIIEYLVKLLSREDVFWRTKAAISLDAIGETAMPVLIEAMGSADDTIASECAEILCRMHHQEPETLIPALTACPRRELAVRVAGSTRSDVGLELVLKFLQEGVEPAVCQDALAASGPRFANRLIATLDKGEIFQRYIPGAVSRFGIKAQAQLADRLEGASETLKISIIDSLDVEVFPKTKEILLQSLKLKSHKVLETVARACARCGDQILFDLQKVFELEEDQQTRYWALYATALIGGKGMDLIHEIMRRDDEPRKKEAATMILGSVADFGFLTAYMKLLSDENLYVRENALRGLKTLGLSALDTVIQALGNDEFDPSREMAMKYLRYLSELAVPKLLDLLVKGDETQRYFAAYALGETGDKSAIPELRSSLDTGSPWVQRYALRSLYVLGGIEELEDHLNSFNTERVAMALEAIDAFSEKALEIVLQAAGSVDESDSEMYLQAVKKMGKAALPKLEECSKSSDNENSRRLALRAIREISGTSLDF